MLKYTLGLICVVQVSACPESAQSAQSEESQMQLETVVVERRLSDLSVVKVASIYGLLNKPRFFTFRLTTGEKFEAKLDPEQITQLKNTQPFFSSRSFRDRHDSLLSSLLRDDEQGMVSGDGQYSGLQFALSSDLQEAMLVVRTKNHDRKTKYVRLYYFSVKRKELFILDSALVGRKGVTFGDFCHDGSALLYNWNDRLYIFNTRTKTKTRLQHEGKILPVTNSAGFLLYQKPKHTYIILDKDGVELTKYQASDVILPSTAYSISTYSFIISTVVEGSYMENMVTIPYVSDEMYLVDMIEHTEKHIGTASVHPVVISVAFKDRLE